MTAFFNQFSFLSGTSFPLRIMPLGDSITRGLGSAGVGDPDADGFRLPLHTGLLSAGINHLLVGSSQRIEGTLIIDYPPNEWHNGYGTNTIAMLSASVDAWLAQNLPDIVQLHAGTVNVAAGEPLGQITSQYSTILDQVSAGGRRVLANQIIPQGPPSGGSDALVQAFNAAIPGIVATKVAAGARIVVVDQYTGFNIAWCPDGVHPVGATAHAFMGSRIVTGVQAVLAL